MISKRNEASAADRAELAVLLVDDDRQLRRVLAKALRREGVRVAAVPSALHALQVLDKLPVRVVVTDLRMPGPSGLRLLETVRDYWPETRRVLLTGYASPEARSSAAVDTLLDKGEDAGFVIDSIVNEVRRRHGKGR